ncbi:non-hydrolyzing UDP-N-acetylglucosamine 2-epimerase [Parabacteroides sp. Marseille-P3160]|uniref:non-hydrolyzing UDP-N-acetylglucosamine 2-epimerase n=1 Tax=Parabacteroides sp. Marseille-P3160 TaxID=1917887 RepID=UPI0009BB70A7|nr:UDP-N-acetylglucosamine 2-epimerase (non-hydrolyzing) [Parabacteroides sp. Marseille-P3160]
MKIVTIVGARPQFVKAAMVSRAITRRNRENQDPLEELILHTGQHYDANMSGLFFEEMKIPLPVWQLHCGNGSHAVMTARMMVEIEKILTESLPDYVLTYGDTNSTLAGALTAAKLHLPVAHVEAGLRSFNKEMPEEINRILTDHVSSLLFCPTFAAVDHLKDEGIEKGVFHVGDVMQDAAILFGEQSERTSTILRDLQLQRKQFYLCTLHRAENTDRKERMTQIFDALLEIATPACPVVLPLHPRTKHCLEEYCLLPLIRQNPGVKLVDPLSFLDMIMLEKQALTILTDSGGVQKEAYFHRTPCITLREETEWTETIDAGWNQLAGYKTAHILQCLNQSPGQKEIKEYGTGNAADRIVDQLMHEFNRP